MPQPEQHDASPQPEESPDRGFLDDNRFRMDGVSLVVSGWILQSSGSPVWLALIGAACFAGAAGSWFVIFRADLARWRQNRRTLMGARAGMGTGGDELQRAWPGRVRRY